ncbi:hypothetical protein T265_00538 [Opisthorchis viverrini]|uniref:Uncharacterized protein n=1 Tax=Opisthorchis viverrini TaxID=6198 RepID=A0A075AJM6_OPIVI|nr:hypothetical protein T265_00538 [Opisthorchis viverrini]KER33649.1 hypothetical protein T265_00538 [Opisthorchis viverrini]
MLTKDCSTTEQMDLALISVHAAYLGRCWEAQSGEVVTDPITMLTEAKAPCGGDPVSKPRDSRNRGRKKISQPNWMMTQLLY